MIISILKQKTPLFVVGGLIGYSVDNLLIMITLTGLFLWLFTIAENENRRLGRDKVFDALDYYIANREKFDG